MTKKNLSRREALKVLGTALGGTALASLPPAWSKPAMVRGSLPIHAQTSGCARSFFDADDWNSQSERSFFTYGNAPANSTINFTVTVTGSGQLGVGQYFEGSLSTDPFGDGETGNLGDPNSFVPGDTVLSVFSWDGGSFCHIYATLL